MNERGGNTLQKMSPAEDGSRAPSASRRTAEKYLYSVAMIAVALFLLALAAV